MRVQYTIFALCIVGTISMYAEEDGLGNTPQQVVKREAQIRKPVPKKSVSQKQTRFVFYDEYDANGTGLKDKFVAKNKSKNYKYENSSRFKFNNGSEQSNIISRDGVDSMGDRR